MLMPITCPAILISGPPELPRLIGASVCSRSVKLSVLEPLESELATTGRPLPEIIPLDTVF